VFADLPGYGYAKLPRELTAEWPKFIEPYLQARESLMLCIVLVDANIPSQHSDKQLVEWLQHAGRRYAIVATKADRLSGSKLTHAMHGLRSDFQTERIIPFSARGGVGRDQLWKEIFASCGHIG
jgi:GTP-binding protein